MLEQLESVREAALTALEDITDSESLQAWESHYIGRKGEITTLLRSTGKLPAEERPAFGKRANEVKNELASAHEEREALIDAQELAHDLEEGSIDITLPGRPRQPGGLHPSTRTLRPMASPST